MGRPKAEREPVSAIYKSSYDNRHHCYVDMGRPLPNGRPDRRHVSGFDPEAVKRKVLALEDLRDSGIVPPKGRQRCDAWFAYWLDNLAGVRAGYNTMQIRTWAVDLYLTPWLGHWWLDELETGHIDLMYATLHKEGLSPKSIELIHETLMLILNKAISYKHIQGANPAAEATRPAVVVVEVEPLNTADTIAFLAEAARRRNFVRWVFGILGARQGECLGARWPDLEDDEILNVRAKVQRQTYRHGCADPRECAAKRCNSSCQRPWRHGCGDARACSVRHCNRPLRPSDVKRGVPKMVCPGDCTGHAKACPDRYPGPCNKSRHKTCPPPCPSDCTGHAKACPQRIGGVKVIQPEQQATETAEPDAPRRKGSRRATARRKVAATKTEAGTRRFAIPDIFQPAIDAHRRQQAAERAAAGSKWEDHGLIVCTEFGRPIDRSRDWDEWCDILRTCGIEHMPLHGLRHTAATILLALGVDRRIVMDILGWRDERMLARYQHVADELRRQAAGLMSAILSGNVIEGSATTAATTGIDGELTTALRPLLSDIENAP